MNFEQALEEMSKGYHIRLSDWMGYWFMIPEKENEQGITDPWPVRIKVFTRNGDILDTPNIERYKDRDDWEVITEIGWGFDMALRFLKNGKRVERSGWNGKGMWIQMVGGGTFCKDDETFNATPYLQIKSVNGTVTPWLPSQTDLLANDWQIVTS